MVPGPIKKLKGMVWERGGGGKKRGECVGCGGV